MITRRDWWLGITVLVLAILIHTLLSHYEIQVHDGAVLRIDRWTGNIEAATDVRALPGVAIYSPQKPEDKPSTHLTR